MVEMHVTDYIQDVLYLKLRIHVPTLIVHMLCICPLLE